MQFISKRLIKPDGVRSRIKEQAVHSPSLRICFGIGHQRSSNAPFPLALLDDDVVDMQMRTAHQRVNGSHPENPDDLALAKRSDEFVPGMALPPHLGQEFFRRQARTQI